MYVYIMCVVCMVYMLGMLGLVCVVSGVDRLWKGEVSRPRGGPYGSGTNIK